MDAGQADQPSAEAFQIGSAIGVRGDRRPRRDFVKQHVEKISRSAALDLSREARGRNVSRKVWPLATAGGIPPFVAASGSSGAARQVSLLSLSAYLRAKCYSRFAGRHFFVFSTQNEDLDMSRRSFKQWLLQQFHLDRRGTHRASARRTLAFETLSQRITPAVNAFFHAGVLTINGDNQDNTI